jgi:hypothetical protein
MQMSETMTVNPLMLPILFSLHDLKDYTEVGELLIAGHLMVGHSTGFGKLIDEKILPDVFGTTKLNKAFRNTTPPFHQSEFDEIDHLLTYPDGTASLLSVKSSRWTIQLTMAVQLNKAFKDIRDKHGSQFKEIVVGVIYGKGTELTDKYDILRGINRGANHDVVDLRSFVKVYAGRDFWKYLNGGEESTQDWLLEGIQLALTQDTSRAECSKLLAKFKENIVKGYSKHLDAEGKPDWASLLKEISG